MSNKTILMVILMITVLSFVVFTNTVYGGESLDLSTFVNVNNGYWLLNTDNTSVKQLQKGSQDFYFLYDKNIINKIITGTIKVDSSTYDNDAFGLVFGYQNINDSYVFSWDKGGVQGAGQIFYHKDRTFDYNQVPGQLLFDGRASNTGWEKEKEYNFRVEYLTNNFKLSINGNEVINITGEFPKGKFGFFSYSQDKVNYSNLKIKDAEHLVEPDQPQIEELDKPIILAGYPKIEKNEQFGLTKLSYQIKNRSQYELSDLFIKIDIDNRLKLLDESIEINKPKIETNFNKKENILQLSDFKLKPLEGFNISIYVHPKSNFNNSTNYQNTIGAYSKDKKIKVSNKLDSEIKITPKQRDYSALIIGKVSLLFKNKSLSFINNKRPKLITSDGRIIEVDCNGVYHLKVDNFENWNEEEILVLEIKLPNRYNKYRRIGTKRKLIKIRPGQIIKKDFNIKLEGKDNG
jgi:hypothetical protein